MVLLLAPRWPRGCSWVWLPVVLIGLSAPPALAQTNPSSGAGQGAAAKKAGGQAQPEAAKPEAEPKFQKPEPELWQEPLREELLRNEFKELNAPFLNVNEQRSVIAMARGQAPVDRNLVDKYVKHFAGELTRRTNIEAMLDPGSRPQQAKMLETAAKALVDPLLEPVSGPNAAFRRFYVEKLLDVAPVLLQGHLHTRTFYMIVLSRTGSPEVVPILISQLKDPNQTLMVKLLAAVGLTNVAQHGRRLLDPTSQAIPAAQALAEFLENNPDAFWPAKWRALEALGSLRQATENPLRNQAELAAVAFQFLSDPESKPDVRAWAGWALSMMVIPTQVQNFNYELVAYEIGRAAADIGTLLTEIPMPKEQPTRNLRLVQRLLDPLLRLLSAFTGDPEIRGSGLDNSTHPSASGSRDRVRAIEQRIRVVAKAGIELTQSAGVQIPQRQQALVVAVEELKNYIAQNPPKSGELYPGGPQVSLPEVKKAPAGGRP